MTEKQIRKWFREKVASSKQSLSWWAMEVGVAKMTFIDFMKEEHPLMRKTLVTLQCYIEENSK